MQTIPHTFYTLTDNIKGKQEQSVLEKWKYSSVQQKLRDQAMYYILNTQFMSLEGLSKI